MIENAALRILLLVVGMVSVLRSGQAIAPGPPPQTAEDPVLRAAVQRYFTTQEAEDTAGYLALWSRRAQRPKAEQLKYIFEAGDDAFTDINIARVVPSGDRLRVRVNAHRRRLVPRPDGAPPIALDADMAMSLTYVKEDGAWKLLREGPVADDLAAALLEAPTPAARQELLETDADLVGEPLISALSRRGSTAAQIQDYPQAAAIFERTLEVARIAGDRKAQGEALHNIANALYFMGSYEDALARYTERLALERERGDEEAIAAALGGIGTVRYTYAEYGVALASYREALAIQDRLGDSFGAAATLVSTGNILYLQGDYEGAIGDYRRSRDLCRKTMNLAGVARALEGLGRVYTAQGDYAAALDAFGGVLAEGRARRDDHMQGSALQHIGDIQFRLGNLDAARSSLEESRGHFEASNDKPNVGRVWQGMALVDLVAGRFNVAEQEFSKSIAACSGPDDRECAAHALAGLAFAQDSEQKFDAAVASYGKAIAAFTALRKREEAARAEVGLSHALLRKEDFERAHAAAVHARDEATALSSDDVLWRALVAEVRIMRKTKYAAGALAAARDAVAAAERLQEAADQQPGSPLRPEAAQAFAVLTLLQAERSDAAAAHATAERMRTFALRATLLANERDVYRGMSPEERAEERSAVAQLMALDAQITRQRSLPKPDAARIDKLKAELEDAIARRTSARQRLFDRLPDLKVWRGIAPPAGASDLATLLARAPDTILVQFVVDEDDIVLLSAEWGADGLVLGVWAVPLAQHWLAERIATFVQASVLKNADEWNRVAGTFLTLMPDEFLQRLARARTVVVIPDGVLWRLPFEALPLKNGYLGDSRTVSYVGSVSALAATWAGTSRAAVAGNPDGSRPLPALVAVSAPEVSAEIRELMLLVAPDWTLRPAAGVEDEVKRVANAYKDATPGAPVTLLVGKDATEQHVRTAAATSGVLHVAAPFRINAASPLFSSTVLTSGPSSQDATDDGLLEAREVINLTLPASAVVLSDGGASTMRDALAATPAIEWAWLASGVPAVVLNRWTTEETSADLLAEYHHRLLLGDSSADALRAARARVREREEWKAPFYWAGWMEVGK